MNIPQRLRQLAASTGLDGFAHELRAIADEMEAQPADVTHEEVMRAAKDATAPEWQDVADGWHMGMDLMAFARAILAVRPVQVNTLAGCNCRWDGDNQVEWCELHLAHKEAIHEWAERAKSAEQKLALRPVQVPMTEEQIRSMCKQGWVFETVKQWVRIIEAHHGIKPKREDE